MFVAERCKPAGVTVEREDEIPSLSAWALQHAEAGWGSESEAPSTSWNQMCSLLPLRSISPKCQAAQVHKGTLHDNRSAAVGSAILPFSCSPTNRNDIIFIFVLWGKAYSELQRAEKHLQPLRANIISHKLWQAASRNESCSRGSVTTSWSCADVHLLAA